MQTTISTPTTVRPARRNVTVAVLVTIAAVAVVSVAATLLRPGPAPAGSDVPVTSVLTEAEAREIGESLLAGFEAGDYARVSRDWDAAMRSAINEDAFLAAREQIHAANGSYVSVDSIELGPARTAGMVTWTFKTIFERGPVTMRLVFPADGSTIAGFHFGE